MVVFAANVTSETLGIIDELLATDAFAKFSLQNRVDLHDNTILIRLAIINLKNSLPSNEEVLKFKAALLRPREFDIFLKEEIKNGV